MRGSRQMFLLFFLIQRNAGILDSLPSKHCSDKALLKYSIVLIIVRVLSANRCYKYQNPVPSGTLKKSFCPCPQPNAAHRRAVKPRLKRYSQYTPMVLKKQYKKSASAPACDKSITVLTAYRNKGRLPALSLLKYDRFFHQFHFYNDEREGWLRPRLLAFLRSL